MRQGLRFVDLFAGLGGFHVALARLGHECVFACEIDDELRDLYKLNFPEVADRVAADIRQSHDLIPPHDILCAGFPCQPFSKSGLQEGTYDRTRGTLFRDILDILRRHRPPYVLLENVGNFEHHNGGSTWRIVRKSLGELGYFVQATQHVASGGPGLLSPHHLGFPHTRERFFIVARRERGGDPWPARRAHTSTLLDVLQSENELTEAEKVETNLTEQQVACIDLWNELHHALPPPAEFPSFPLWGDEIEAMYPYEDETPYYSSKARLAVCLGLSRSTRLDHDELVAQLPSYARDRTFYFPAWKTKFIRQNRQWFAAQRQYIGREWQERLHALPPSLRKLEWNCKGEDKNLWNHILQFRPSGLRVKRITSSPALVAMTTTQIPIVGPRRRFITRLEGLRLQGFPDGHRLPKSRAKAFHALGNAVHVDVVDAVAQLSIDPVGAGSDKPTQAELDSSPAVAV